MRKHDGTTPRRLVSVALAIVTLFSTVAAQQRETSPARRSGSSPTPESTVTLDSLLAADTYKVYCEIRGVGGLVRSSAVNDLLEPVIKLGGPPREFKSIIKWLNGHAEALVVSRMLVAGWPTRPNVPNVLLAIEFSSPEEAKKFYPALRDLIPTLLPTPAATPTATPPPTEPASPARPILQPGKQTGSITPAVTSQPNGAPAADTANPASSPPYQMRQTGSLILLSDTAFTLRDLKPRRSKPLEEDQNFALARNRFASEPLFLYVDVKSIEKEEKERRQKWEEEEQKRVEAEAASTPIPDESPEMVQADVPPPVVEEPVPPAASPEVSTPTIIVGTASPQPENDATLSGSARETDPVGPMMFSFFGMLTSGETRWPEAIAAAAVLDGDAYVVRTLIISSDENKSSAVPFVPLFVSGPPLAPDSPGILPGDVDLFVSVSLDYPQIYEGMLKSIAAAREKSRRFSEQTVADAHPPESPFAIYEQKLGLKIRDDILPLLGNELALVIPAKPKKAATEISLKPGEENSTTGAVVNNSSAAANPVIAIGVKDREAVGRLLPKIIEGMGLKGANLLAQTEKRDGTEIVSYAGAFSYAFVGDFLIFSPDPAETRHVVDAYLSHQTLSSDSHFRNFTRWQPRQLLGQVYVAPSLVEQYTVGAGRFGANDKLNQFLSRVNPVVDPLTYALSNDGSGPLHELHLPKNLVQLLIAGASSEVEQGPLRSNEAMARSALHMLAASEATYSAGKGSGRYATLDELISEQLVSKDLLENNGYRIELTVSGNKFEATAVPIEYGKTGRLSFFIDESGALRAGDHNGGAATISDTPM
ncbi:MAG TPA: DUF3352 domain-containing protein [Pyrinomonadaceae bacterium]|nr:DUF3352 domain-containing protein [Pyrinomonadaceae bacterium]